jgi:ABC-2 type transport system permease protein
MWPQVLTIAWAQWRTARNHLPRTGAGTWMMAGLGLLWYCSFAWFAYAIFRLLSVLPAAALAYWLSAGILAVCVFWQVVPLMTLTGGWSLNLKKLQSFPIRTETLFGIETALRVTTGFEMVLLVVGATAGLYLNPSVRKPDPLLLLLIVPFNLLLSLGIREFILHSFARNRLREIFALLVVSIGLIPQVLVRTPLGSRAAPYALAASHGRGMPWAELARLSTGHFSWLSLGALILWILAAYAFAHWMFLKGLGEEETMRGDVGSERPSRRESTLGEAMLSLPGRIFDDPMGMLIEKEIRTLLRMPRFRVILGMACLFSVVVFFPLAQGEASFVRSNFLEVAALYGILILSDALFWNIFGFDRSAAQIYFASPVELRRVFQAKNLTAVLFVAVQNAVVFIVSILLRFAVTPSGILAGLCASAVVTIFFLAAGNLSSVTAPRAVDPAQTLRKQSSGQRQLWLAMCSFGMFALVGLGILAGWAMQTDWALITVLAIEFGVGVIVFRVATDSAIEKALARREEIIEVLSKGASQIAL